MADDRIHSYRLETYRSLIAISVEGFKFSALANGGAAVALLAYLGNVTSKGVSGPDMRCPMAAFLAGLAMCGIAMLLGYLTQLSLFSETNPHTKPYAAHGRLLWAAIACYACSLVAFGFGSWQAVLRFR